MDKENFRKNMTELLLEEKLAKIKSRGRQTEETEIINKRKKDVKNSYRKSLIEMLEIKEEDYDDKHKRR